MKVAVFAATFGVTDNKKIELSNYDQIVSFVPKDLIFYRVKLFEHSHLKGLFITEKPFKNRDLVL